MAEQHAIGRGQRQRVAGAFFPGQVFGARHQLLRLHPGKLREGSVGRLIAPDALGRRKHRVAAVALFVVAIVLVAVDHHLVADLPAVHLVSHRPDDPGSIRPGYVEGLLVAVKRADRLAKGCPNAVVIDARRHHQHQHLMAVDLPGVDHLDLHRGLGLAMALAPDRPGIHLFGHMAQGRHLANLVKVFLRRVIGRNYRLTVQGHHGTLLFNQCRAAESGRAAPRFRDISATLQ